MKKLPRAEASDMKILEKAYTFDDVLLVQAAY